MNERFRLMCILAHPDDESPGTGGTQPVGASQDYYRVFSVVNGGRRKEEDLFEGLR